MTHSELPPPNLDKEEIASTINFIAECKADGVDCTALENYIAPLLPKRVDLNILLDRNERERTEE